ncbi:MAG: putative lipopolysaccharide heptosyltransferase III [Verrucomicrobiota bacterium]
MSSEWTYLKPSQPLSLPGNPRIQRIGLFKFRNIGDVLLMTPAIRAIREAFPKARITAIVNSETDAMLQGNPHLDEILIYDRSKRKGIERLQNEFRFFREVRRRHFDLTVNLVSGERPAWCSLFSGAKWRVTYYNWWPFWSWYHLAYTQTYRYPTQTLHQVPFQYFLLKQLGIPTPLDSVPTTENRLELVVAENDQIWAEQFLYRHGIQKFVHIHPVSRWLFKCWDDLRMAQVIDWIQESLKLGVVLTCGPEEKEKAKAQRILDLCRIKPLSVLGQVSLKQTAALIQKSEVFLGVDTAPMHMAAALGRPVIALFGPSGVGDWAPWSENRLILNKGCPCGPNLQEGCDHHGLRACMKAITIEDVKEALEATVGR